MNREFNFEMEPLRALAEYGGAFGQFGGGGERETTAAGKAPRQATAATPVGPFGTLVANVPGRRQFQYGFTAEDVLWTARFLVGEAGGRDNLDNQAVIWAMFNRYALFTHRHYPTFQRFIRAYSTPLQPVLKSSGAARRHMHKPEFVRTGGTYEGTDIPRGQLARFLKLQQTPWGKLPASARSLAERALKGQVANPIGNASEFASTRVYFRDRYKRWPQDFGEWRRFTESFAAGKKWVWVGPVSGLDPMKNTFFVQKSVANLAPGTVRVMAATPGINSRPAPAGSSKEAGVMSRETYYAGAPFEVEPEVGFELEGYDFEFGGQRTPPPPTEGPVKGITGGNCPSGRGKCWPASGKSRDVIDADVPWNDKTKRSIANYEAVLDYFNVGNRTRQQPVSVLENARYRPVWNAEKKRWSTWCNIYGHDVTRAMWASIPHWVQSRGKWHELTANATYDWLLSQGRSKGWIPIDAKLCGWIQAQARARAGLPRPDPSISDNLSTAAQQVASNQHPNQALLAQPSYIAQQFGNLGLPTAAVLKNQGGIGHIAMIRPERGTKRGVVGKTHGKFVPRTAQAGGSNWTNELMTNMERAMLGGKVLFVVHE